MKHLAQCFGAGSRRSNLMTKIWTFRFNHLNQQQGIIKPAAGLPDCDTFVRVVTEVLVVQRGWSSTLSQGFNEEFETVEKRRGCFWLDSIVCVRVYFFFFGIFCFVLRGRATRITSIRKFAGAFKALINWIYIYIYIYILKKDRKLQQPASATQMHKQINSLFCFWRNGCYAPW